ncbi:hypothetical protein SAMN05444354_105148 [Stigmatella aurantiaca]|uniref:Uncharacterized protein n=2 Tax=Stigmatella aurantiaca TaxID=41 RepID=A0A1H7P1W0_STIAU|nr:hypothetical protein SAMN05444354_105148 [Stigmatella aurantiaca]
MKRMNAAPFLLLLAVLQQTSSVEDVSAGDAGDSSGDSSVQFRALLEAGPLSFPSGTRGGEQDFFAAATPVLRLDVGENFALEVGATLRFRLVDQDPKQTAGDYGGHLRREDWDTPSDLGQLIRELRLGREEGRFFFRAGPLTTFTLGEGHLVDRYVNQLSADYHPAGATATGYFGPFRLQVAASDVLAMRLFAGELRMDLGRMASTDETVFDRYHVNASLAHDFGRVGEERTEPLTAALVGGNAAIYKGERFQLFAMAGAGSRVDVSPLDFGGFVGLSARGMRGAVDVSGRLEGRSQGGSFRFGLFGPSYELSRFSATGLSEEPLAEERLSRAFSGYGELRLGLGDAENALYFSASAAAEYFAFGRIDTDMALMLQLPGGRTRITARAIVVGLKTHPRYSLLAELRQRLLSSLYVWGSTGTVHFPQADGTLVRGFTAGAGVGVDWAR